MRRGGSLAMMPNNISTMLSLEPEVWGEMHGDAGVLREPGLDHGVFVGSAAAALTPTNTV